MTDIRTLLRKHDAAISEICDSLYNHKVSGADGEQILLWIAGLSAGFRQTPIAGDWLHPIADAWKLAAASEPSGLQDPERPEGTSK